MRSHLLALRPNHWLKNLAVLPGPIFSGQLGLSWLAGLHVLVVFLCFCAASSASYLVNDAVDVQRDRLHPRKRFRPIAAGKVTVRSALLVALCLAIGAVAVMTVCVPAALPCLLVFVGLQFAYTLFLKNVVLLDVFSIAAGFLARIVAGVLAVDAPLSPWLMACSTLLALLLALAKRRAELSSSGASAPEQRPVLAKYTAVGLDVSIAMVAGAVLVSYSMYTLLPGSLLAYNLAIPSQAGRPGMVYTLPFVLFAVLRLLHVLYATDRGEQPELLLFQDPALLLASASYLAVVYLVLY